MTPYVNAWQTVRFTPKAIVRPRTPEAVADEVRKAQASGLRLKALGGGHSFNHILRTDGVLVDLRHVRGIVVDRDRGTADLAGGTTLRDAITELDGQGFHFPTLGSWFTQTIAGAIATSTHGSSLQHGCLSDLVEEVEAVLADGSVARFAGDDPRLPALRAHLGQLGIITRVTIRVVPAFWLACSIRTVPDLDGFASIASLARQHEYASLLWLPYAEEACIRILERVDASERNRAAVDLERRYLRKGRLYNTVEDLLIYGYSHAFLGLPRLMAGRYTRSVRSAFLEDDGVVDKSYRVFLYDRYREPTENHALRLILNSEYAIELGELESTLREMKELLEPYQRRGRLINYPRLHVRFAPASDRTLIGLNAGRTTAYVGLYIVASVRHAPQIEIAEGLERILIAHDGRPHWGKYRYVETPEYERTYPGLPAFRAIQHQLDPDGLFSDGVAMFAGLDRFQKPSARHAIASLFARDTYDRVALF